MQPRLRATLVVATIAIASGIAGAAIDRTFLVHPPRRGPRAGMASPAQEARRRNDMLDRLARDLALTPAQRTSIDTVFQRMDSTLHAIRREAEPRVQVVIERSRAEVASHLDPAQREKFAALSAERDRQRRAARQ